MEIMQLLITNGYFKDKFSTDVLESIALLPDYDGTKELFLNLCQGQEVDLKAYFSK